MQTPKPVDLLAELERIHAAAVKARHRLEQGHALNGRKALHDIETMAADARRHALEDAELRRAARSIA